MNKLMLIGISAGLCFLAAGCVKDEAKPRQTLIDKGWNFSQDSAQWVAVDLPHDWSVAGPYDPQEPANNDGAYLPTGKGYYTKQLAVPDYDANKKYRLYFEGAYQKSKVYINGEQAGGHPYGYSSFYVDATPYLHEGENAIVVAIDNSEQRNCRWYTGSGIYRHVWLEETEKTHLDPWGIYLTTAGGYGGEHATLSGQIDIQNETEAVTAAKVAITVIDGRKTVAKKSEEIELQPGTQQYAFQLALPEAKLWTPAQPNLYVARISLIGADGKTIDQIDQSFGVRTFQYSADGLLLNGKPIVLNGACVHHDNGILGAASHDAAEIRKAQLMKQAGFNAVRTSHNPPAPAFLNACDSIGLIVIDEAFDGWSQAKTEHDYAELIDEWWDEDIAAMVLRDRNHPSIMAWSIGNEVIERKSPLAVENAHKMASLCRELDPSRPVTSALAAWDSDWEIYDNLAAEHDIVGYNYMIHKAEGDHQRVPSRVMWQTESYPRDAFSNWKTTYDHPYIIGDFVWTGLDYLGESGIGRHYYEGDPAGEHWERSLWPWHGAYCGDVDITGLRKPISYYRDMLWNREYDVYMAVREPNGYDGEIKETLWGTYPTVESWTWPGWEGKPIEVEVYTLWPYVTLYFNNNILGTQEVSEATGHKTVFTIPYQPGTLRASSEDECYTIVTAGEPAKIRLESCQYPGQDVAFIIAELVDESGNVVPIADNEITFAVSGAATVLGAGSANMKDCEPYATPKAKAWRGRAMAAIRAQSAGKVTVTATSPDLPEAEVALKF